MTSNPAATQAPARSRSRRLLARWRPWFLPGGLALLLAVFLAMTPWGRLGSVMTYWVDCPGCEEAPSETALLPAYPEMVLVAVLGSLSAVAGVVLARRRPVVAVALAAWPMLSAPFTQFFVWGWWLALVMIAVVGAVDSWRRAILPTAMGVLFAGLSCFSMVTAVLPVGPVLMVSPRWFPAGPDGRGEDPDAFLYPGVTLGDHLFVFALYVLAVLAVVGIALAAGIANRRVRRSETAAREAVELETAATERARVARDLHDVVAHHISLIAVRAESAPFAVDGIGPGGEEVLASVAEDARGALAELRTVLAVLQRAGESRAGEPTDPLLAPQPGAGDIGDLVDAARMAGQDVVVMGAVPVLPPAPGYVLYRAVQEALTNARRHAFGGPVTIGFSSGPWTALTTVRNPLGTGPVGDPGRGLVGMRERVEAIGGSLDSGTDGTEFVVSVHLPLTEPARGRDER